MTVNLFNSTVNLPKFCNKLGYKDYQFVRIPTFGWYAYNTDKTFIGNIFDLVNDQDREHLYAVIAKDKPEYLDFDLAYSGLADSRLKYDLMEMKLWTAAYSMCQKAIETYKVSYQGKKTYMREILSSNGLNGAISNKIGVITGHVLETFKMLPWPKKEIRGKLIIPSFSTPYHIASLEYCSWDQPTELLPLYVNDEKGWYGNIRANKIVSDIKELFTTPGNTWDYKADYWYDGTVNLSEFLDIPTCIKVWTDAQKTVFSCSPLDQIIATGNTGELKNYVGQLSYNQLEELEEKTGEKLKEHWRKARELQVKLGNQIFAKRENRYFVYKKGKLLEITNFAIDIDKIIKMKNGKFMRKGLLHFGNKSVPFELGEEYFTTNYKFQRGIKEKFLSAGLGVPIIHPEFFGKSLLLVDSFNSGAAIEME